MPDLPAISLDNVSKRFTVLRRRSATLKDRVIAGLTGQRERRETLWALRDVSLEVAQGETVAIIGANGCGKSTLLQLVAGILEPDAGRVESRGRVTSLLELGAGFSPDLSGRENIFLNASLHGVPRAQVAAQFDAIVAFSELDAFIDTPVRNYSSGMYMRLAFAVAVHLDPQCILVDEAFAVGDESFQRKCLRRLREFQQAGVTVLLVSHDLSLVERFATRACLLDHGRVRAIGAPLDTIAAYHTALSATGEAPGARRWGSRELEILGLEFLGPDGSPAVVRTHDPLVVRMTFHARQRVDHPVFGLAFYTDSGVHLTGPNTKMAGVHIAAVQGEGRVDYHIADLPFTPGRYLVSAAAYDSDLIMPFDHRDRFVSLTVSDGGTAQRFGMIDLPARWDVTGVRHDA